MVSRGPGPTAGQEEALHAGAWSRDPYGSSCAVQAMPPLPCPAHEYWHLICFMEQVCAYVCVCVYVCAYTKKSDNWKIRLCIKKRGKMNKQTNKPRILELVEVNESVS